MKKEEFAGIKETSFRLIAKKAGLDLRIGAGLCIVVNLLGVEPVGA